MGKITNFLTEEQEKLIREADKVLGYINEREKDKETFRFMYSKFYHSTITPAFINANKEFREGDITTQVITDAKTIETYLGLENRYTHYYQKLKNL